MKTSAIILGVFTLICAIFVSCSKDDDELFVPASPTSSVSPTSTDAVSQSKIPVFCPTALSLRPSRKIHCSYLHLRNEPNALLLLSSKIRFTHEKSSYGFLVLFWTSAIIIFFEYISSVAVKWNLFQLDGHSFLHSDIFAYFCMSEHHP